VASIPNFYQQKGRLRWPVAGSKLNSFGQTRSNSDLKWHGIRLRSEPGSDVHSISYGRVAFADWLPGFGLIMIIDHNEGFMSLYGQNQALYKETGDWVNSGDPIASTGNTVGEEVSSLYFEIRHNGKPVDPAQWCSNNNR
jgi:septal ring factor EnvC (AmiA/AmiB activator)